MVRLPTVFAAALALSACAFSPDMELVMADDHLAKSKTDDVVELELLEVVAEIEAEGYALLQVPDVKPPRQLEGYSAVTLHENVVLAPDFPKKAKLDQLRILRHELAHIRERKARGRVGFAATYATDNGRFVIEGHGLRQEVRDMCDMGQDQAELASWIDERAEAFPAKYHFRKPNRAAVAKATRDAMTRELAACEE